MSVKICVSDKFILGLKIKGLIRSQVVLSVLTEEVQRGPEPRQYINKEGSYCVSTMDILLSWVPGMGEAMARW